MTRKTSAPRRTRPGRPRDSRRLHLETLEDRCLLANSFLQGLVYHDVNGNGVFDNPPVNPEPLLEGVTVRLLNSSGVELQSRETGADGYYLFDNLAPARYRLVQDPLTDNGFYSSAAQALSQLNPATIPAGTTNRIDVDLVDPDVLNVDYTYVFADYRHLYRGVQLFGRIPQAFIRYPDEAPAGQIPVTVTRNQQPFVRTFTYCADLEEPDGEPIEFPVGDFRPQVLRGPIGYLFNRYGLNTTLTLDQKAGLQLAIWEFLYDPAAQNLRAGNFQYILPPTQFPAVEAAANGYIQEAQAKSEPALFLRMNPPFPGEPDSQHWLGTGTFNFGNRQLAMVDIWKWNDLNANGRWDAKEPGLPGWTIEAVRDGQVVARAVSMRDDPTTTNFNEEGLIWMDLPAGTYVLREVPQEGWLQTYPGGDGTHTITVAAGEQFYAERGQAVLGNFGNTQLAMIDAWKWNDLNGDGRWDTNEPGLAGWTIQAVRDAQVVATAVTLPDDPTTTAFNEEGLIWMHLPAGTYTLREVLQPGWRQTYPGGTGTHTITVAAGEQFYAERGQAVLGNFGNTRLPMPGPNPGGGRGGDALVIKQLRADPDLRTPILAALAAVEEGLVREPTTRPVDDARGVQTQAEPVPAVAPRPNQALLDWVFAQEEMLLDTLVPMAW